jgi:hypothetical protein
MRGYWNWIETKDGRNVYIVDYEPRPLIPMYDEKTAKKVTELGRKYMQEMYKRLKPTHDGLQD